MVANSRTVELQDLKRIMSLGSFYTISTGYKKSSSTGNYTQEYKLSIIPSDFSSRQNFLEKALQQTKKVSPPSSLSLPPPFPSFLPFFPLSLSTRLHLNAHSMTDTKLIPESSVRVQTTRTPKNHPIPPPHDPPKTKPHKNHFRRKNLYADYPTKDDFSVSVPGQGNSGEGNKREERWRGSRGKVFCVGEGECGGEEGEDVS